VQIVITHELADFDALSSAVAAQKLYPGSQIVLAGSVGPEVFSYLALHKDRFVTVRLGDFDPSAVTRVIVVDVRVRSRLKDFEPIFQRRDAGHDVELIVYDHHPVTADDLVGDEEHVEPVGSATTLLVECLRAAGQELDPVEATLFALGIHADTGSLTFAATSARDALALGWLLERGVQMPVLRRYLRQPFSAEQTQLLQSALADLEQQSVGHLPVAFFAVRAPAAVGGAAEVATALLSLTGAAAVFLAVEFGKKRVHLSARSKTPLIDVGSCVGALGGGGHAAAASASLKSMTAAAAIEAVKACLRKHPPAPKRIAEVMTSPVHVVDVEAPLSQVQEQLSAWMHVGAPVLRAGKLVGMLSRRDLQRAQDAGRFALPAASCMSHDPVTIEVDASLEEALSLMQARDVGRLPVLAAGRMVGIVTRSDLLSALYERDGKPPPSIG
jgi:tRNA nucleotidyltransferase (CCA-adding enzyme)